MPIHWIESNGGPYILMGIRAASMWRATHGISVESRDGCVDDYQCVCGIGGYAGVMHSGDNAILVIDDLPNDLAVYLNTDSEAVFVKWIGAESEEKIWAALDAEKELSFKRLDFELQITESELVIFDSSDLLDDAGENKLYLNLLPGFYSVEVLDYEPHDEMMLQLFRLRRIRAL